MKELLLLMTTAMKQHLFQLFLWLCHPCCVQALCCIDPIRARSRDELDPISRRGDVLQHVIAAIHKYGQSVHRDLRSRNDHQLSVLATLNSPDTVDRVCFFRHVCGLVARFRVPGHTECYRLSNHCDHVSVFREPHVAASSLTAELLFRCQNGGRITLSPSSLRRYCDMDLSRWSHNLKWQHHDAQKKYDGMNRCTCLYRYTHLPARMCMQCIMNVFIALWT